MRTVRSEHSFPCSPSDLFAIATDGDHVVAQRSAAGARDVKILRRDNDGTRLHLEWQEVQEPQLPGFAKKVLPARTTAVQREEWDVVAHTASWTNEPSGLPGDIRGTKAVTGDGDSSTLLVEVEIKVKVPLVGGRIEGFIAGLLESELAAQAAFTLERVRGASSG